MRPSNRRRFGYSGSESHEPEIARVVAGIRSPRPVKVVAFSDGQVNGRFDRLYLEAAWPSIEGDIRSLKLMALCDTSSAAIRAT